MERRAEESKNGAREGPGTAQRDQIREELQLRQPPGRVPKAEAVQPRRARGHGLTTLFREPPTESDVREADGRSCDAGKLPEGDRGGSRQRRSPGNRPDAGSGLGETPGSPLGEDPGEAAGRNLRSHTREANGNQEAERGCQNARNSYGDGSVHTAVAIASDDAGIRADVQRL